MKKEEYIILFYKLILAIILFLICIGFFKMIYKENNMNTIHNNTNTNSFNNYYNYNYNISSKPSYYPSNTTENNKYLKNYSSKDWKRYYEYHKYIGCSKEEVINSMGDDYYTSTNSIVYTRGNITAGITLSIRITFKFRDEKVYFISYYDQNMDHGIPTYIE